MQFFQALQDTKRGLCGVLVGPPGSQKSKRDSGSSQRDLRALWGLKGCLGIFTMLCGVLMVFRGANGVLKIIKQIQTVLGSIQWPLQSPMGYSGILGGCLQVLRDPCGFQRVNQVPLGSSMVMQDFLRSSKVLETSKQIQKALKGSLGSQRTLWILRW